MPLSPFLASSVPHDPTHCLHCRTLLIGNGAGGFCCAGCQTVHELINREGLQRYYTLRGERSLAPVASLQGGIVQPWLEQLAAELAQKGGVARIVLDVQGISCAACVWLIESLFQRSAAGLEVRVNPAVGRLSCLVGPGFDLHAFVAAVESFGYRLGPPRKQHAKVQDALLLRTGVCFALAANTMLLSSTTYFGLESGSVFALVMDASMALVTLSALIGGSYFGQRALSGLRRGLLHLDLPIALGIALAYAGSAISWVADEGRGSYFDTVSVFIALMLLGRLLQERLIERNRRALLASEGASTLLTRRIRDGRVELVPCGALAEGDELLVCPGELVPVRARLDDDAASCTLDWINGESEPRRFDRDEELVAGAANAGNRALRAVALAAFQRSDLDLLLRDEGAEKARPRGDFWDRLARVYVTLVLLITALGIVTWVLLGGSRTEVLDVATGILVVTCPCALGIATPLAYELAVAGLRRAGLYVRDATYLDRATRVRRIVFDKTGTLTTGALRLVEPERLQRLTSAQRAVLYDLTAQSNHPKSAAIARALTDLDATLRLRRGSLVDELPGRGVSCTRDGVHYRLGDARWALANGADSEPVFSADGEALATLACIEVTRPDLKDEVRALRDDGYVLHIASGDRSERVAEMASALAIPPERAMGDLKPADKRALIERLDAGDTLMLGDGINDAPALARALCSGTPAIDRPFVPARADFYFQTAGLAPVRLSLRVALALRRVVHRTLVGAALYNVLAIGLCYAGLMRPWLAAVLMPASSLIIVAYTAFALGPGRGLWRAATVR